MISVYSSQSDTLLGSVSESDLKFLIDNLEEESLEDQDYYIDLPTVDFLEANGASEGLITFLRTAIGEEDSVTILWRRT